MFPWADQQQDVENSGQRQNRRQSSLRRAGSKIIDNTMMPVAGTKQVVKQDKVSELFNYGAQSEPRNALQTMDINGGQKRNRYGQVMQLDAKMANQVAGQLKNRGAFGENSNMVQGQGSGRNSSNIVFGDEMNQRYQPPQQNARTEQVAQKSAEDAAMEQYIQMKAQQENDAKEMAQRYMQQAQAPPQMSPEDEALLAEAMAMERYKQQMMEQQMMEARDPSQAASHQSKPRSKAPSHVSSKPPAPLPPRPNRHRPQEANIVQDFQCMENSGYSRKGPTEENLARLYFQGGVTQIKTRSSATNNRFSSQDRIFGNENGHMAPADDALAARGKKLYAQRTNSMRNLLNGYSEDANVDLAKQMIKKPNMASYNSNGQMSGAEFKQMQTRHQPLY